MKIILALLLTTFLQTACTNKKSKSTTNKYKDACCCEAIINVGSGKIYVPSLITPNFDGVNDAFVIIGDTNINLIFDINIKDYNNNLIASIDTFTGYTVTKNWNCSISPTQIYKGIFTISGKILDKNNIIHNFNAKSCSFTCDVSISNVIPNFLNCKLPSMLDYNTFTTPYNSGETSCFQ